MRLGGGGPPARPAYTDKTLEKPQYRQSRENFLRRPDSAHGVAERFIGLIFGGVLDRHQKLRITLPHGGGALSILIGRIDHGWRVRPEIKHLPNAPSTYLKRFTYDTIVHSKEVMQLTAAERAMIVGGNAAKLLRI